MENKIRKEVAENEKDADLRQFRWVFDKWRMLTCIIKIREKKEEGGSLDSSIVTKTVQNFVDSASTAFGARITELEETERTMIEEKKAMEEKLEDSKREVYVIQAQLGRMKREREEHECKIESLE